MESNEKCERFILDSLRSSPCRLEAFDGREFNKQTVNASINDLLHSEEMHYNFDISSYQLGPPPLKNRKREVRKPNFKLKKTGKKTGQISEHKMRAKRYTGELSDKSSAEKGSESNGQG